MRKPQTREVRIEISENAVPMEEALAKLAKVIAAEMYREDQQKKSEGEA